ncbi:MAG: hypothetical protein FI682_01040 [SAR202 cluster bacterium]|nr:hypothetical protein [SAR202 cluster bacterium]RZP17436.1 MAG: hypothetical protein EVA33_02190 [Chloroflexota bacterium]|tara:strand:- start:21378 stop:21905 length:528 start_codon:yes stop_codon:yes gene_type:complete
MTLEELIISAVRIFASLIVFKFNFFGAILVILIDFSDLFMMNLITLGGVRNYQFLDKFLDLFYIAYFLIIALRWEKLLRNISILLFVFRILGFVLFEFFQNRLILFIFPNVFEFWFLGITLLFLLKSNITNRKIIIVLVITTLLKMIQEYILHVWKVLDNYRAIDVLNSLLDWFG